MPIAVACDRCGKTFKRPPSEARSKTLFCSSSCSASYHAQKIETAEQFWPRVAISDPTDCWPWTGYCNPAGYGQTAWKGKVWLAHRVAMALTDGDWDNKLSVCHSCDNPPCCNPAHLWRGTHYQNQQDKIAKGRLRYGTLRGEASPQAKLTSRQVTEIRSSIEPAADIAMRHGISISYVHALRSSAVTWSDIPVVKRPPRTHCSRGHEYTGKVNTNGARICMICENERKRAWKQRNKQP